MTQIKTDLWLRRLSPFCSLLGAVLQSDGCPRPCETLLHTAGPTDEAATVSPEWG